MAFNTFFDLAFISSIDSKRFPRNGLLRLVNSQCHTELNQTNTVVVEWYLSHFWRKTHVKLMQCEMAHYSGAKIKSCLTTYLVPFDEWVHAKDCLTRRKESHNSDYFGHNSVDFQPQFLLENPTTKKAILHFFFCTRRSPFWRWFIGSVSWCGRHMR